MQAGLVVLVSAVAAVGTSVLTLKLLHDPDATNTDSSEVSRLANLLQGQERKLAAIAKELQGLRSQRVEGDSRVEVPSVDEKQIAEAVGRWMAANGAKAKTLAAEAASKSKVGKLNDGEMKQLFLQLSDMKSDYMERSKLWEKLTKSGQMDQMIARLEEYAKNSPNDADAQTVLGHAYVQKIMTPGLSGLEQMKTGMAIDKSYRKALKIDPEHWEARFSMAIGLSYQPSFLGGQAKAIKEFTTLMGQQESRAPKPGYSQTYLMLGNLYAQQGKNDKAKEAWERGAKLFPNNSALKERLGR